MITMPTSAKHRLLLEMAQARAVTASRAVMFERIGRSLDEFGSLTPAMIEACYSTIASS